jgi:hypothetical protein
MGQKSLRILPRPPRCSGRTRALKNSLALLLNQRNTSHVPLRLSCIAFREQKTCRLQSLEAPLRINQENKLPLLTKLALAAFVTRLEGTGVPILVTGMHGAEPPPAAVTVEGGGRVTGLIHGRNGLTRPLEVPGLCLTHLLQYGPSSCGQYTPVGLRGMPGVSS